MARTRSWSASFSNLLSKSSADAPERKNDTTGRLRRDTFTSITEAHVKSPHSESTPPPRLQSTMRPKSRPVSIMQILPTTVEIEKDTLPELQPVFNFMNFHSQKLYTEGYFLKLADLTPDGKPGTDRSWKECFAQLRGTVLSLWDAAELDAAGLNEDVVPTFINLTDASIKMIDKMPTRSPDVPPLTNVLSISTAGRNRYLFHFNTHNSLAQWTASIRLCMFEHSKLQEIYTGALIAAKGKNLNAIRQITARTTFKYEDWVRVRFGAGTPWRKCWAVIEQPDEKMVKKAKAQAKKAKNTAYQQHPIFKGDIKFYDTKKSKKTPPIATIIDAFAAYALYPQAKQLVDMSTLVKIEGRIRIHGDQATESEGYVFVMPEVHPAVSGFETMLRFLFPTFDTFALYGRPGMLIADKTDVRSLMFAMPVDGPQKCGYLDVQDVVSLVVAHGNNIQTEVEWRDRMKTATKEKIQMLMERQVRPRNSLPAQSKLSLENDSGSSLFNSQFDLPPQHVPLTPGIHSGMGHQRAASEATGYQPNKYGQQSPYFDSSASSRQFQYGGPPSSGRSTTSSDEGLFQVDPAARRLQAETTQPPLEPVPVTPMTTHPPNSRPSNPLPQFDAPSDNLFAGVVPLRTERRASEPINAFQHPATRDDPELNQIAEQRSMGYDHQMEAPPGFALQSSHLLLRGPPPTNDTKSSHNQEYANEPPSGRPGSQYYTSQLSAPQYAAQRASWGPTPPSGSTSPGQGNGYSDYLPSPPLPSMEATHVENQSPPPNRKFERKPVPNSTASDYDSPDSLQEFKHLIDESALDRIGPHRQESYDRDSRTGPSDYETFDRKNIERMQRTLAGDDSESDYDDDEPDYASSINSDAPPPKRDYNQPRAGVMKVVGQKVEPDVVIGDAHYRPNSSGKQIESVDVPRVDFGTTFSHGRSLSADINLKGVARGNAAAVESDGYASQHGTLMNGTLSSIDTHRRSPGLGVDHPSGHAPSGSSAKSGDWNQPSSGSQESDSDAKRRNMMWQPSASAATGNSPDRSAAERYVAEKAAAAQSQSRNRYAHQRKSSSNNMLQKNYSAEMLPTRGPNAAFMPNGLVSAPDLSSHLSAREQEYVAKKTGSTLLRMDTDQRKAPPHTAGLIGAIESRETEKKFQRGQASLTVQQEIARRQQQQLQRELSMQRSRATPSPRAISIPQFEQQGYFPQQQQQQYYQQQQQQSYHQHQQMGYAQGPQRTKTPEGYQNQYYGRN